MTLLCRLAFACLAVMLVADVSLADDKKPAPGKVVTTKGEMDKVAHRTLTPEMVQGIPKHLPNLPEAAPLLQIDKVTQPQGTHAWGFDGYLQVSGPPYDDPFVDLHYYSSLKIGAKVGTGTVEFQVSTDPNFAADKIVSSGSLKDLQGVYRLDDKQAHWVKPGGDTGKTLNNYIRIRRVEAGGQKGPYSNGVSVLIWGIIH